MLKRYAEVDFEGLTRLNRFPTGTGPGISPTYGGAFLLARALRLVNGVNLKNGLGRVEAGRGRVHRGRLLSSGLTTLVWPVRGAVHPMFVAH
jgi:hypothetical protein